MNATLFLSLYVGTTTSGFTAEKILCQEAGTAIGRLAEESPLPAQSNFLGSAMEGRKEHLVSSHAPPAPRLSGFRCPV